MCLIGLNGYRDIFRDNESFCIWSDCSSVFIKTVEFLHQETNCIIVSENSLIYYTE